MTGKEIRARLALAEEMDNRPAIDFGHALLEWRRKWANEHLEAFDVHDGSIFTNGECARCVEAKAILAEEK